MLQAVILMGGKSQRMGTDKSQMEIHGKPQYIHLYELLSAKKLSPFLSCNKYQYEHIPNDFAKIVDRYEGIGPIGGLASAIYHDHKNSILLVACDLFNITDKTIQQLLNENDTTFDVVTFRRENVEFPETTITIYNPGSFKHINAAVEAKRYSLQSILKQGSLKEVLPIDENELKNINTREDLID